MKDLQDDSLLEPVKSVNYADDPEDDPPEDEPAPEDDGQGAPDDGGLDSLDYRH